MKENVMKKQLNNATNDEISMNAGNTSIAGGLMNDDDSSSTFSELKTPTTGGQVYITPTQNVGGGGGLAQSKKLGQNAPQSVHH
jgi:hypothetical protein